MHMAFLFAVSGEEVLYGYGPLGVGVVAMATGLAYMFRIIVKDRDKAIEDRDALLEDLFTKVIPAIMRNTDVLEKRQVLDVELIEAIKRTNNLREQTKSAFEGSKRAFEEFRRTLESLQRVIDDRGYPPRGGM